MDIVRNCINIVGITPEEELPKKINGQLIENSQAENLFVEDSIKIKNIYQVIIDIDMIRTRVINAPMNKIVVVDFNKKLKIAYYDIDSNMGILEINSPYNVFFDLENDKVDIEKINIHIADAYFELVNGRTLYNNILYVVDVQYLGGFKKRIGFDEEIKGKENWNFINKKSKDNLSHALKEVSISEENKAKISKESKLYREDGENELFNMEDEYL